MAFLTAIEEGKEIKQRIIVTCTCPCYETSVIHRITNIVKCHQHLMYTVSIIVILFLLLFINATAKGHCFSTIIKSPRISIDVPSLAYSSSYMGLFYNSSLFVMKQELSLTWRGYGRSHPADSRLPAYYLWVLIQQTILRIWLRNIRLSTEPYLWVRDRRFMAGALYNR